ncbi:MAG: 30S ribosomal protein S20 [candidate division Zixibacteria bacterium]|nr:30S ribosomal protein S20 [candidate division Zixibacteria bacterium]
MPQHKSCAKRMKTSAVQRDRNRAFRTRYRSAIRDLRAETNAEEAARKYRLTVSMIDQATTRGLLHKNNAARNKARLAVMVNKLS